MHVWFFWGGNKAHALVTILNVHETFLFLIYLSKIFRFSLLVGLFFLISFVFFLYFLLCVCVSISWVRSLSCSLFCWLVGCILLVGWWVWIPPRLMLHYGEWGGDSPVWWVIPFLFFPLLLFSFLPLLLHSFDKQHMIMTSLIYRRPYYSEWLFSLSSSFFLLNTCYVLLLFACPVDEEYDTPSRWWFIILSFSFSLVVLCGFRVGVSTHRRGVNIWNFAKGGVWSKLCLSSKDPTLNGRWATINPSFVYESIWWRVCILKHTKIYKE